MLDKLSYEITEKIEKDQLEVFLSKLSIHTEKNMFWTLKCFLASKYDHELVQRN